MGLRLNRRYVLGFAICLMLAAPAAATAPTSEDDVLAPLVATPIASPNPVLATDDKVHLVYELVLLNLAGDDVTLNKVETLDAASGAVIYTLEGEKLALMLKLHGAGEGTALPGAGSGILFMDVTLDADAAVPKALKHRFGIAVAKPSGEDEDRDRDPAPEPQQEIVLTGDPLPVGTVAAVVVAPPLKGKRWVIGGGCCAPPSYHRGATLPINGAIRVPERFAIDFVRLNDKDMLYQGDMEDVSDYAFFGDPIYAVADGTVVTAVDGLPEQIPGKLPEDATIQMAGGNHVVVDIGEGRFAFYAHMQPGSLKVKVGDKVKTGQVLGLLGNTGNTDTPHLHFHIMDSPSPLIGNGLPYVFTSFTSEGRLADEDPLFKGGAVTVDTSALTGSFENRYPLADQVVNFP